jgi:hypothetical protein
MIIQNVAIQRDGCQVTVSMNRVEYNTGNVQGVSKKFGEWYQEKKKQEDTNKLTILAFKIILILHKTQLATFIKVSGKCQERPF